MYKNVTLVCLNSKYIHTSLAIWYLKAYSQRKDINCIDSNVNLKTEVIINKILDTNPQIVGFSCYIFNIVKTLEVAKKLRELKPDVKIFFGGPEASYENDYMFEYCDQIIVGEGEQAFVELLNGDNSKIIYGKHIDNPLLISPYTEEYFENAKGKIAYFEASRGCPFSCHYCMSSNDKLCLFDLDFVKKELLKFKGRDIKILKFVDRTFNASRKISCAIIQFVIDNFSDEDMVFHFEIAPDLLDEKTINTIAQARVGLVQFEAGIQTFNSQVLKNINRRSNLKKAIYNIDALMKLENCHVHSDLIAGLQGEDIKSFENSFNRIYELQTHQLQLGILKVLKGSPLKNNLPEGYIFNDMPPYEIFKTPWLSYEEVDFVKRQANAVDRVYNSGRFNRTLKYLTKFITPFQLFKKLAYELEVSCSLFKVYDAVYKIGNELVDEDILNELLKFDYLVTDNSKNLPPIIKREFNKQFKKIANINKKGKEFCYKFNLNPDTMEKGNFVIYFDYNSKNRITGRYNYRIENYDNLLEEYNSLKAN